jgi:hypothetical protein
MKKILPLIVVMSFALGAWAQQSLGEIARKNRAKKKPASIISLNDDNMPRTLTTNPDDDSAKDADKTAATAKSDQKKEAADAAKEKEEASKKLADEVKKQKDEVARLQHELDIAQREQRLSAAAFYGDAGVQLRDQAKFAEESRKKQEEIDGKTKAIDTAQQKLADLEEVARKAGLSSSE